MRITSLSLILPFFFLLHFLFFVQLLYFLYIYILNQQFITWCMVADRGSDYVATYMQIFLVYGHLHKNFLFLYIYSVHWLTSFRFEMFDFLYCFESDIIDLLIFLEYLWHLLSCYWCSPLKWILPSQLLSCLLPLLFFLYLSLFFTYQLSSQFLLAFCGIVLSSHFISSSLLVLYPYCLTSWKYKDLEKWVQLHSCCWWFVKTFV